jgi:Domain of Unknown Function (DUF928)
MKWSQLTGVFSCLILLGLVLPSSAKAEGLNFIFNLSGDVQLKRTQWGSYQPAFIGTLVYTSDRLRLGKGAKATVQCANLSIWNVPSGKDSTVTDGCSPIKPVLPRHDSSLLPTRAASDPTLPYLISPRNTAILTDQPTLRWHPVDGAKGYQLQVQGPEVNWTTQVSQPEVAYAGPLLKPGLRYLVTVTADNGASTNNEAPVGFTLLTTEEVQRVKAWAEQVQQQPLSKEAQTLTLAYLYRSNNLNAAAIDALEQLIQKGNQTSSVHQRLGELYQEAELNQLAKERYLKALELAKAENNLEGQASVQASLGEVNTAFAQLDEARQWYQKAQVGYQTLGDKGQVKAIQRKLDYLEGR